jgi:MFS family permease
MALSGRISSFLATSATRTGLPDLSLLTSLLSIVVAVAFFAGIAYAAVAIPAQTQLQEDIPEDVRGRVFGVLNMLVSVASFLPILVVGPIADALGTTIVLLIVGGLIAASGVASIYLRGPLRAVERDSRATVGTTRDPFMEALGAEMGREEDFLERYGNAPRGDRPGATPENAEALPAADPVTAASAPLDADAVTRPIATDELPAVSRPAQPTSDDDAPDRG